MTRDWTDLERLGRVSTPDPAVLEAAREQLWAEVAREMLSPAGPGEVPGTRRAVRRDPGCPRQAEADP